MRTLLSLLLLCGVVAAPMASAADEAQKLEPVFVSATRSDQPQNRLPAATSVITREQIAASGVNTVADALRSVAGVQVNDFYGDGSQYTTVDMRGFGLGGNANTLILVDGRRLNNPDIASPDLSSISLKDVERIEIINGSAGSLYGDQAVGGVINIITRQPTGAAGTLEAGGGSYGKGHASGSFDQRLGGFFMRLSGSADTADNYRDNNHHENGNATARGGYDYGSGSAYVEAGAVKDRDQLPGALTAAQEAQDRQQCQPGACNVFADGTTTFQRLDWEHSLSEQWGLETDVTHRHGSVEGLLFGSSFSQDRQVYSASPRATGKFAVPAGTALLTAGADFQFVEYVLTSALGQQNDTQRTREFYAQAVIPVAAQLEATVGARTARVQNVLFDGFNYATPTPTHDHANAWEAGLAWKPLTDLRVFARYDANYRFAKADEFFNPLVPPAPGQNSLQTQTGGTYEIGGDWKLQTVDLHASIYRLGLKNEISFAPGGFPGFFLNTNLDHTRREGVVLNADWQALQKLKLSAGAQYLKAEFTSGPFSGNDVPLVARRTGRLAASYSLPWNLSTLVELQATGKRLLDADFTNAGPALPGFAVTNVVLSGNWNHWRASARVNNLFGHEYSEYGVLGGGGPAYYPSPTTNFWLNLGYTF